MPTPTYSQIYTTTVTGSATTQIEFGLIPATYSDLVMVCKIVPNNAGAAYLNLRVGTGNSIDTGGNYSAQQLVYTNGSVSAYQYFNDTNFEIVGNQYQTLGTFQLQIDINGYTSTAAWKTVFARVSASDNTSRQNLGPWKNTSALNIIRLSSANAAIGIGSTASLYGILRA